MKIKKRKVIYFVSVIDYLSLAISFSLASLMYLYMFNKNILFLKENFLNSLLVFSVAFLFLSLFINNKNQGIIGRSNLEELYNVIKVNAMLAALVGFMIFILRFADDFSRGAFILTFMLNVIVSYIGRLILKKNLHVLFVNDKRRILLVSVEKYAESAIAKVNNDSNLLSSITDIILVDKKLPGTEISGIPIVGYIDTIVEISQQSAVDDVLFYLDNGWLNRVENSILSLQKMGIKISVTLPILDELSFYNKTVSIIGDIPALSCYISDVDDETLYMKRFFDIIGGIIGSFVACIVILLFGPIIKLTSKGPILFKQKRVGLNGRYFYIYKLRTMVDDADAKKKELMDKNEVDGLMFKMTDDPRVTRIGKFLRATSLDEFPQFFNVLKGDMSLVGTRPPTVDEFKQYKPHHKRRLSMKPGITGMWQVSGRSNVTDFEEVVKLDLEYIDNCTITLDFKIIAKTFVTVLFKIGSR